MTCACTENALRYRDLQRKNLIKARGRFGYNPEGEQVCTVDSFGFRSRYDGECDDCWKSQIEGYNKSQDYD